MSVVHNAAARGLASDSLVIRLPSPYLLFLGDVTDATYAKTAFGLRDWAPERCVGELSCAGGTVTTGLPRMTPAEARAHGARALLIGIANEGGRIMRTQDCNTRVRPGFGLSAKRGGRHRGKEEPRASEHWGRMVHGMSHVLAAES